jgi:hypothetical protein
MKKVIYTNTSNTIQTSLLMKIYAVIHAVCGLYEGYSDTTCEFYPDKETALKHIKQHVDTYREDEMCVRIEHDGDSTFVTMTPDFEDYNACVPEDMDHDDWVADNDPSVEVFRIIEIDAWRYDTKDTTEHMWLTWDQQDTCVAWDYYPLCMSLVARVSSDVVDNDQSVHALEQLTDFISSVYHGNAAFIDIDDYTMHAFRIPKKFDNQ